MDPIYSASYYYYSYLPILFNTSINPPSEQMFYYTMAPMYQSFMNPAVSSVSGLSNLVSNLTESVQGFLGESGVFNSRSIDISTNAVSGTVEEGAPLGSYEVNVLQMATEQINTGNWLSVSGLDISAGTYEFEMNVGGTSKVLTVNVESTDTNLSVLEKMANAINEADLGVSATVEIEGSQARIVLRGQTGEENAFTIEDLTGNLVEVTGASNMTQSAQNLVYTVNGLRYESARNEIDLPGVSLNVNEMPEGPFEVNVTYNVEEISRAVENLVEDINTLSEFVNENSENLSPAVVATVENLLNNPSLENIGIVNEGGRLAVTDRFQKLLENPTLAESLVRPTLEGFLSSVQNTANTISQPSFTIYTFDLNSYIRELLLSQVMNSFSYYA